MTDVAQPTNERIASMLEQVLSELQQIRQTLDELTSGS